MYVYTSPESLYDGRKGGLIPQFFSLSKKKVTTEL